MNIVSAPVTNLFTYDSLRDWLIPDLTKENIDKILKIVSTKFKTHNYNLTSIIQAFAKLSLELQDLSEKV